MTLVSHWFDAGLNGIRVGKTKKSEWTFFFAWLGRVSHSTFCKNIRVLAAAAAGRKEQVWQLSDFTSISQKNHAVRLHIISMWTWSCVRLSDFTNLSQEHIQDELNGGVEAVARYVQFVKSLPAQVLYHRALSALFLLCTAHGMKQDTGFEMSWALTSGLQPQEVEHTADSLQLNLQLKSRVFAQL